MGESFGDLLRNHRLAAGMSLADLASRINYSKGHLSKVENGHKTPNAMFAKQCDRVLATDGALAAALPPAASRAEAVRRHETRTDDDVWVIELHEGSLGFAELPRRQVLAGAGAPLGYAVTRTARPEIDEQIFSALRASFDQFRTLGTMASPSLVLAQVIAHVHTLRTLAADNPEPMRSDLLLLAARVAEYAGWMSQEAGHEAGAARWTDLAARLAAGRDPHMASFALFRHAEIAMYRNDPVRAVELARRAQQDRTADPRILGLAARCEAQGHAIVGNLRGYESALERAASLLAVPQHTTGPVLGSASVPDEIALVQGWALYELGHPGTAAELLDRQILTIPPTARRARARFGVRRALAHAQNGDIDQACVAAREILADAAQVDSATIRRDLLELSRTLGRWHTHREAADLRHELVPVLRVIS